MTKRKIDHIVYCVPDLEKAISYFKDHLGVTAVIGGKHLLKGTKNALINLGDQSYLELLAIDHENKNITSPRWMGIDFINRPKITRWAIQSGDMVTDQKILNTYNPDLAIITEGQRKTTDNSVLKWQMMMPLPDPEVELIPFMLSWKNSAHHPTDNLESSCTLTSISFYSKENTEQTKRCFQDLNIDYKVESWTETKITATITGPKGEIKI